MQHGGAGMVLNKQTILYFVKELRDRSLLYIYIYNLNKTKLHLKDSTIHSVLLVGMNSYENNSNGMD